MERIAKKVFHENRFRCDFRVILWRLAAALVTVFQIRAVLKASLRNNEFSAPYLIPSRAELGGDLPA